MFDPKPIKGVALRLTRNDACDVPLATTVANSRIETDGFVRLTMTNDWSEGEEIEVRNANGDICVYDSPEPVLRGMTLELQLCGVPYYVLEMLAGYSALMDGTTNVVGMVAPKSMVARTANSVQLEVWQRNAGALCGSTADRYVRHLLPLTRKWTVSGDIVIADGAVETVLSGYAESNPRWAPSITGEYLAAQVTAIKAGGPHASLLTGALPLNMESALGYAPTAA